MNIESRYRSVRATQMCEDFEPGIRHAVQRRMREIALEATYKAGERVVLPVLECDEQGYVPDAQVHALRVWEGCLKLIPEVLDRVAAYFNECGYGRASCVESLVDGEVCRTWRFATGGWSGCEDVIDAMEENLWIGQAWESSHRGGLHVYRVWA